MDVPLNVRYWRQSGHGADLSVCPLMTDAVEKRFSKVE
jgi:hypothetical protein